MNGSPKTSVNTAVNTVLTHAPGKTRVYLQKTRYTREIPGSASMPRAPYSQGPCATCGAHRLLKYAHRTMCARYKCQKARPAGGGADDAVVPTFCFKRHPGPGAPQASRPAGGAAGRPRCARRWLRLEAGLATEVLAFFWHPHNIAHHPRVHQQFALLAALCAAAFWCSKTSLHAAQANGPSLPFIALRPVSAHRPASAWACGRRRDNSGLWWRSFKEFAPDSPASNGACQHLPRGGVNTFEHLYGCGVNR